ncbi:MAG: dihydroxy-acid dehydratase [Exilibacterium sp.]
MQNGDEIEFNGPLRTLNLLISDQELEKRLQEWGGPATGNKYSRGYYKLYIDHVLQADQGCDLDFLTGGSGCEVERESH